MKRIVQRHTVEYWFSMLQQFRAETDGFKLELSTLPDSDLLLIKWAIQPFLDLAPVMFGAVMPKHHADLRRSIAYIADLYERQQAARERQQIRFDLASNELGRVVKILQNAPMSNLEKINLVKNHYGWV